MGKAPENKGFVRATAIMTFLFLWLMSFDKISNDGLFFNSITLFGNNLMAEIPGDHGNRISNEERIKPQKIRQTGVPREKKTAANHITPERMATLVKFISETPVKIERRQDDIYEVNTSSSAKVEDSRSKNGSHYDWEKLAEQLTKFYQLDKNLQNIMRRNAETMEDDHLRLHRRIDDALQAVKKSRFASGLDLKKYGELPRRLYRLEGQELTKWRQSLRQEMDALKQELRDLRRLRQFPGADQTKKLQVFQLLNTFLTE